MLIRIDLALFRYISLTLIEKSSIIFLPFFVCYLRVMEEISLEKEMLNFEHIHLRFHSNDLSRSILSILRDPIIWHPI